MPIDVQRGFNHEVSLQNRSQIPLKRPSLRITTQVGKVLGVFPKVRSTSKIQKLKLYLPLSEVREGFMGLQVNAGRNLLLKTKKSIELGQFTWKSSWATEAWKLWKDRNGNPIGLTSNIFEFQGNTIDISKLSAQAVKYNPFICRSMPPYTQN